MKKPELSIIILNYNTKKLLVDCLKSLIKVSSEVNFEIIVSDNGSTDGSLEMLNKNKIIKTVFNKKNLGFAAGNNAAKKYAKGEYILFLNSDTRVPKNTLKKSLDFIKKNKKIGVVTCKMKLPNGGLDPDARRSFPTPWVSLTHFTGLDRVFSESRLFSQYWYGFKPTDETHEIEVAQGAFLLTTKKILDEVGWFNEEYFLDGEDIDLSWKICEAGYQIYYYPKAWIWHTKKGTKKDRKKLRFVMTGVDSMLKFYTERMWDKYPLLINLLVYTGIKVMKSIRFLKYLSS